MSYLGYDEATLASLPHDNRGGETIAAVSLCMAFATIAVGLRLYTRRFVLRQFWLDDYLAIAGLVSIPRYLRTARNQRLETKQA